VIILPLLIGIFLLDGTRGGPAKAGHASLDRCGLLSPVAAATGRAAGLFEWARAPSSMACLGHLGTPSTSCCVQAEHKLLMHPSTCWSTGVFGGALFAALHGCTRHAVHGAGVTETEILKPARAYKFRQGRRDVHIVGAATDTLRLIFQYAPSTTSRRPGVTLAGFSAGGGGIWVADWRPLGSLSFNFHGALHSERNSCWNHQGRADSTCGRTRAQPEVAGIEGARANVHDFRRLMLAQASVAPPGGS